MNTWSEVGNAKRAEAVFERMRQDYLKGNVFAKPTLPCFRSLLKAWYNSEAVGAGEQADFLLEWLPSFGLKPDVSTLITVRRCWELHRDDDPRAKERIYQVQEQILALERKSKWTA
jgi:hypothetical protein